MCVLGPAGLIHSRVNPTCGDLELLILFNSANPVLEKAVPALLDMPPSRGQCGRATQAARLA